MSIKNKLASRKNKLAQNYFSVPVCSVSQTQAAMMGASTLQRRRRAFLARAACRAGRYYYTYVP
jgi:hypothetical protein